MHLQLEGYAAAKALNAAITNGGFAINQSRWAAWLPACRTRALFVCLLSPSAAAAGTVLKMDSSDNLLLLYSAVGALSVYHAY